MSFTVEFKLLDHIFPCQDCIVLRFANSLFVLQAISSEDRRKILLEIADALEANQEQIMNENEADVAAAEKAGYERSLIARLALKPGKVGDLSIYLVITSSKKLSQHITFFSLNADNKPCQFYSCTCKNGRSNWACSEENRGKRRGLKHFLLGLLLFSNIPLPASTSL